MAMIEVDFEVFKELTVRRKTETMTENDVIREALKLPPKQAGQQTAAPIKPWVTKGVEFPEGTEFRANYKGKLFTATVHDGALVLEGKSFTAPSAAAVSITGNPVNGWNFWECRRPGESGWQVITQLRK